MKIAAFSMRISRISRILMKTKITTSSLQDHNHDLDQRERALDPTESFIVQAPAGSGKTELLTQRFLVLLGSIKQPEEILAITFTKKSAAEMRARIIHALKSAQENQEPDSLHAKKTWHLAKKALARNELLNWNIIDNPSRLQIQTIDSLNASLTRQLPLLSHFGAPLEIADNPQTLYREAVQEFLSLLEEQVAWADPIEKLLLHRDNDLSKVEILLINMLAKRDQWLPYVASHAHHPDLRKKLEGHLAGIVTDALSALRHCFREEESLELITLLKFAAQNLMRDDPDSSLVHCKELTHLPESDINAKKKWQAISKLLLTEKGEWRKTVTKKQGFPSASDVKNLEDKNFLNLMKSRCLELIEKLSSHEALRVLLNELNTLPDPFYQDAQWETLHALHDVLRVLVAQLKMIFQQHGKIDYIENAQGAILALGSDDNPTDITLAMDYKIQHILIDEFQDTSNSQYRLLEKLMMGWQPGENRTLFVVGDPMQSIYRFREAEVGLFIRARISGISSLYLTPLTLSLNFRSTPSIVDWVNEHFVKVFPAFEDIASGAVSYSPSTANQTELTDDTSQVRLHPFLNADENSQANAIVETIRDIKSRAPQKTIAILVRSRTHLQSILPALKNANLTFRALDIEPLATRPVIQDLSALTRALLHPADRIAWLAILRAPWCGLSLSDLLIIAQEKEKSIIWQQLKSDSIRALLSVDGQAHLVRIFPILEGALAERQRTTLREWVEKTWLQLGGPACVLRPEDLEDAEAFFKLLEKLDECGDLPNISHLNQAINKLYAAPNNQADTSLQIMTIHNAKGLEFDAVILPHLERKASRDERQLLQWMERPRNNEENALILAPIHATGEQENPIYDYIKKQHDIKTNYENARLLYVAATRARKELHLFFNLENINNNTDIKHPVSHSLLEKLWSAVREKITKNYTTLNPVILNTKNTDALMPTLKRLSTAWKNPFLNLQFEKIIYHQKKSGFDLPNDDPKIMGTLIHLILQQLSLLGMSWWQSQSKTIQKNYIQKNLLELGMSKNIIIAIETISRAIQNTLHDPRGQWILQHHEEAKSEFSLTTKSKTFIIDRTFIDAHGTRWIIDYKSSENNDNNVEDFLKSEQKKYEKQLWDYSQALRLIEKRPIRVGLYFPLIPAWKEWAF